MDAELIRTFTVVALVLPGIFFVGLGSILVVKPQSTVVAAFVTASLVIGSLGQWTSTLSTFSTLALVLPAYQYLVFRILHRRFTSRFQRSPQTAAFNFTSGILADRLFSVALFALSVLLPVFTVAYIFRA
jgi:hypothetical protein